MDLKELTSACGTDRRLCEGRVYLYWSKVPFLQTRVLGDASGTVTWYDRVTRGEYE